MVRKGRSHLQYIAFLDFEFVDFYQSNEGKKKARRIASVVPLIRIGLDLARVEIYVTFQLDLGKKYLLSKTFIYIYIVVGRGRNGLIEFDMYPFDFQNNDTQPFHSPSAYPHTLSIVLVFSEIGDVP